MTWDAPGRSDAGSSKARRGSDRASAHADCSCPTIHVGEAHENKLLPDTVICDDRPGYAVWLRVQVGASLCGLQQWMAERPPGAEWDSAFEAWRRDLRGPDDEAPARSIESATPRQVLVAAMNGPEGALIAESFTGRLRYSGPRWAPAWERRSAAGWRPRWAWSSSSASTAPSRSWWAGSARRADHQLGNLRSRAESVAIQQEPCSSHSIANVRAMVSKRSANGSASRTAGVVKVRMVSAGLSASGTRYWTISASAGSARPGT
jgi:hypothetical protein